MTPGEISLLICENVRFNNGLLLEISHSELAEFYGIIGSGVSLEDFRVEIESIYRGLMEDFWVALVHRFVWAQSEYCVFGSREKYRESGVDDAVYDKLLWFCKVANIIIGDYEPKYKRYRVSFDHIAFDNMPLDVAKKFTVDDLNQLGNFVKINGTLTCNGTWRGLFDQYIKFSGANDLVSMVEAIDCIVGLAHHSGDFLEHLADPGEDSERMSELLNAKYNAKDISYFFKDIPERVRILLNKKRREDGKNIIVQRGNVPRDLYRFNRHNISKIMKDISDQLLKAGYVKESDMLWFREHRDSYGRPYNEEVKLSLIDGGIKVWQAPVPDPEFEREKVFEFDTLMVGAGSNNGLVHNICSWLKSSHWFNSDPY
jgi:hypothetical protein